jgi:hypothetical protein
VLEDMEKDAKPVLILVDHVQSGMSAAALHVLLKELTKHPHLRVVGAGRVRADAWLSPQFKKKHPSAQLLELMKEDLEQICNHMIKRHHHLNRLLLEAVVDQVYIFI